MRKAEILGIFLAVVPGISHRCMHIGDMKGLRPSNNSFGITRRIRKYDIIVAKIKLLNSERHQRRKQPMVFSRQGPSLEERGIDALAGELSPHRFRIMENRINRCVGPQLRAGFKHPFGTAILHQIIMDESDLHRLYCNLKDLLAQLT